MDILTSLPNISRLGATPVLSCGGPNMQPLNNLGDDPNYAVGPSDRILSFPLVSIKSFYLAIAKGISRGCSILLYMSI